MKVPAEYESPRTKYQVCFWEVITFLKANLNLIMIFQGNYICHQDEVEESGGFPIKRICIDGKVKVFNKVTRLYL